MKSVCTNPHMEKVRAAYRNSPRYRRLNGDDKPKGSVIEFLPRVPGQDDEELALGIGRDPLETEFMGGAK